MVQFIKRFTEWLIFKQQLDSQNTAFPIFKEGDIWWCHIGENIGTEISGKSDVFTRPILILKKYDRYSFLGLPLTTKERTGTWYLPLEFNGRRQAIILTQGRRLDHRRLQKKIGQITEIHLTIAQFAYAGLHSPVKEKTLIDIR